MKYFVLFFAITSLKAQQIGFSEVEILSIFIFLLLLYLGFRFFSIEDKKIITKKKDKRHLIKIKSIYNVETDEMSNRSTLIFDLIHQDTKGNIVICDSIATRRYFLNTDFTVINDFVYNFTKFYLSNVKNSVIFIKIRPIKITNDHTIARLMVGSYNKLDDKLIQNLETFRKGKRIFGFNAIKNFINNDNIQFVNKKITNYFYYDYKLSVSNIINNPTINLTANNKAIILENNFYVLSLLKKHLKFNNYYLTNNISQTLDYIYVPSIVLINVNVFMGLKVSGGDEEITQTNIISAQKEKNFKIIFISYFQQDTLKIQKYVDNKGIFVLKLPYTFKQLNEILNT